MNSSVEIINKFNSLYRDIDSEIVALRKSQHLFKMNQVDFKNLKFEDKKKDKEKGKKIEEMLKTAKKIDSNIKKTMDKKSCRKKFIYRPLSSIPPIWDENKLNHYMKDVLSILAFTNEEIDHEKDFTKKENDEIIKNETFEKTSLDYMNVGKIVHDIRNVGTNVNFLIHNTNKNNLNEKKNLYAKKRVNKKSHSNDLKNGVNIANEKSFPGRIERIVNNEDKSVNVNFKKHFETSKQIPQQLTFSPTTFTSTNEREMSKKSDNVINILNSNLVTNCAKQISKVFLPVLSIKGKCRVQKIYQFEILPTSNDSIQNDDTNKFSNVKFIETIHEHECVDTKEKLPFTEVVSDQTKNGNMLLNINDIKNVLRYYNVKIHDEKNQITIEKRKNKKKLKILRQKRQRNSKIVENEAFTGQIKQETQQSSIPKKNESTWKEEEMSSSLTDDDRKLCDILKFYDKHNKTKEKGNKDEKTLSSTHDRYSTYPYPANSSSNETPNMTNEMKKSNDLQYNVISESFQSIYKLIEDTFQSNLVESNVKENNNNIYRDDFREMKQVIKMAEDNIKKAENLLQKYKFQQEKNSIHRKDKSFFEDIEEKLPKQTHTVVLRTSTPIVNNSIESSKKLNFPEQMNTENNEKKNCNQSPNYEGFTQELHEKLLQNHKEIGIQTNNDKSLQTESSFDYKTRVYFKTVYDTYDNIDFNKSKKYSLKRDDFRNVQDKHFTNNPVSYNTMYSSDEEIMKVASKFLRSIEKNKKNQNIESSEEESYSDFLKQDLGTSYSSVSTPLSDILQQEPVENTYYPTKINKKSLSPFHDLDYTPSEGEVLSLGEVRIQSSSSDEISVKS